MNETATPAADPVEAKAEEKQESFIVFLLKLALIVLVFRSFVFSPFNIPSESMLPRLINGDYLLAAKWPYGYSRYSLPLGVPLIPGRILASQPERGDVVIFKAPPRNDIDYIKRVIGLPGDQVQMRGGQLFLNGQAVPRKRLADFVVPVSPNTRCFFPHFEATLEDGAPVCRYPRYSETLPGGRSYEVLDLGPTPQDDTEPVVVPEGMMFMMGDNRDNSLDSRFPTAYGVGYVPYENLVGRADRSFPSWDAAKTEWYEVWNWPFAVRWDRLFQSIE